MVVAFLGRPHGLSVDSNLSLVAVTEILVPRGTEYRYFPTFISKCRLSSDEYPLLVYPRFLVSFVSLATSVVSRLGANRKPYMHRLDSTAVTVMPARKDRVPFCRTMAEPDWACPCLLAVGLQRRPGVGDVLTIDDLLHQIQG